MLLSFAGGGDRPPVISLAVNLAARGHDVRFLCDPRTAGLVLDTGIPTITHDVEQVGFTSTWLKARAGGEALPNPLSAWAEAALPVVWPAVEDMSPGVLVSSLFSLGLAGALADRLGRPLCFVNPSFFFSAGYRDDWEADWHGPVSHLAQECFVPLMERADLVLHATDPIFDPVESPFPPGHHMVGFLLWEPNADRPGFLDAAGDPWALVTGSTARPGDEETMLTAAVAALADQPVRTLLTLPKHDSHSSIADGATNARAVGFAPHTPILQNAKIAITQAGHGVVSKCLTHGVPMVLMPWDADQPGVAARAATAGTALVVPRDQLNTGRLRHAVDRVLNESEIRRRAEEVKTALAQKNPAETAAQLLEDL